MRKSRFTDAPRERLHILALRRPYWGYRRLYRLLRREGMTVNRKRVQRVYRNAGLSVRRRARKRVAVERLPRSMPVAVNIRWSRDVVSDALADERKIRARSKRGRFRSRVPDHRGRPFGTGRTRQPTDAAACCPCEPMSSWRSVPRHHRDAAARAP